MPTITPMNNNYEFFDYTITKNKDCRRKTPRFRQAYDILTIAMQIQKLLDSNKIELGWGDSDEELTDFAISVADGWDNYVKKEQEEHPAKIVFWDFYVEEEIIKKYGRETISWGQRSR